jgi:hypothetical protein
MPWPRLVIQTSVGFFVSAYLAIYGTRSLTFGNDFNQTLNNLPKNIKYLKLNVLITLILQK